MEQLIAHIFGDYILQSDWMANEKTKRTFAAFVHATVYTLPFLFLTRKPLPLFVIWFSHFLIDRFRLARYVVYAKNYLAPKSAIDEKVYDRIPIENAKFYYKFSWENCRATGYPSETPPFLAVWLLIIADNGLHLLINHLSLKYL